MPPASISGRLLGFRTLDRFQKLPSLFDRCGKCTGLHTSGPRQAGLVHVIVVRKSTWIVLLPGELRQPGSRSQPRTLVNKTIVKKCVSLHRAPGGRGDTGSPRNWSVNTTVHPLPSEQPSYVCMCVIYWPYPNTTWTSPDDRDHKLRGKPTWEPPADSCTQLSAYTLLRC